jgi:hypothetical protein
MPPDLGPRGAGAAVDVCGLGARVAYIKLAEFQILRIANRRSGGASRRFMTPPIRAPRPAHYRRQYKASTTSNLPPKLISCTRTPTHTLTHAHSGETARAHSSSLSEQVSGTRTSSPGIAHTHATPSHLPLAVAPTSSAGATLWSSGCATRRR